MGDAWGSLGDAGYHDKTPMVPTVNALGTRATTNRPGGSKTAS